MRLPSRLSDHEHVLEVCKAAHLYLSLLFCLQAVEEPADAERQERILELADAAWLLSLGP